MEQRGWKSGIACGAIALVYGQSAGLLDGYASIDGTYWPGGLLSRALV
jgi:hypothetical protein